MITKLNDQFRTLVTKSLLNKDIIHEDKIVFTTYVFEMLESYGTEIFYAILNYDNFDENNDPYGEHDFGSIIINGQNLFWKIDYYDNNLEGLSPDAANEKLTTRIMTVMLASEY